MNNKICLISQQGSGTNLLRSFLNSHPDIYIADEIFSSSEKFKWYKKNNKIPINDYLEEFFNVGYDFDKLHIGYQDEGNKPKVLGFDLKYNNIESQPEILDWLIKENIKIIHLYRCRGRTFLRNMNEINKATLTYKQFEEHIKFINYWEEKISKLKIDNYLKITYEDMTRGKNIIELPLEVEYNLLNFLGVDYKKLVINNKGIRDGKLKMRY